MEMKVELLYFDGYPHYEPLLVRLTVRIDSCDVEPDCGDRDDFGLTCRLYRSEEGTSGTPPERWITAALRSSASRAR
jgi:hypothetical protein